TRKCIHQRGCAHPDRDGGDSHRAATRGRCPARPAYREHRGGRASRTRGSPDLATRSCGHFRRGRRESRQLPLRPTRSRSQIEDQRPRGRVGQLVPPVISSSARNLGTLHLHLHTRIGHYMSSLQLAQLWTSLVADAMTMSVSPPPAVRWSALTVSP